jgi:hypothetical protein
MTEPQELVLGDSAASHLSTAQPPDMPFHPLAGLFPMPSEMELRLMADDIATNGLLEPIVTLDGQILDGRCRYVACKMAGVKPAFENYVGDKPLAYVLGLNLHRRHLSDAQRAMVAARVADLGVGANQLSEGVPIGTAARLFNVSARSVARARTIIRNAPELIQEVESGVMSINAALNCSTPPKAKQNALHDGDSALPSPDEGSSSLLQSSVKVTSAQPGNRPTQQDGSIASNERFSGWLWNDIIPLSGVTVIAGGAATTSVATKIAATVDRGWLWPDRSTALNGGVICLTAGKSLAEQVRWNMASGQLSSSVHVVPPEIDAFGLPIRHFALDLDRLQGRINKTSGVVLVMLEPFLDHVRCDDMERSVGELRRAIEALSAFAIEQSVAVVLPCELSMRNRTDQAVNAFKEHSEIATILVAASRAAPNSGSLLARKLPAEIGLTEFPFHLRLRASRRTLIWDALEDGTMNDQLPF